MVAGILVVLAMVVIVVIHELGHFLTARWVGIRATKFYVFFPPAAWKKQVGEVEYGIGWIPLGGFVKLPGMFEPTARDTHWRLEPAVDEIREGIVDSDLQLQVAASMRAVRRAPDADGLALELRELRSVLRQVRSTQSTTTGPFASRSIDAYQLRLRRLESRILGVVEDCHPRAYWRADLWRRMAVILAGPIANVLLAFVVLWVSFAFLNPVVRYDWKVAKVTPGSPAAKAGVQEGDAIAAWNGMRPGSSVRDANRFFEHVTDSVGSPVVVSLQHGNGERTYHLETATFKGKQRVGIAPGARAEFVRFDRRNPVAAARRSASGLHDLTVNVVTGLPRLVTEQGRSEVTTVVGFVKIAPKVHRFGQLVSFMAAISMVIAVMNMLPLLPLDGGHVLFGLIEFFRRGRPLPRGVFERYSFVGLALMLGLFVIGLQNDLGLRN